MTTSEFNDAKARLETVVASLRKGQQSGPTLMKRQPPTDTTGTQDGRNNKSDDDDQPPVLRRWE